MKVKVFMFAVLSTALVPLGSSFSMDEMFDEGTTQSTDQIADLLAQDLAELSVFDLQRKIIPNMKQTSPGYFAVQHGDHLLQMKEDDLRALHAAFYDPFHQSNDGLITHMTDPDHKKLIFVSVEKKEGNPTRYWVNFSLVTNENGQEVKHDFHFTVA